jgi:hypothetical protein
MFPVALMGEDVRKRVQWVVVLVLVAVMMKGRPGFLFCSGRFVLRGLVMGIIN